MSVQISIRKSIVLVLILTIGLGLAFALTSMARAGSRAVLDIDFTAPSAPPKTYHVAKSGDGDGGLEWSKAFTDVQDALGAAISGDEIWVAAGIYTPGETVSDSFNLVPGVAMYGGFAATEIVHSERDWEANPTILSGDIDGDDTNTDGVVMTTSHIVGDNSYHVVFADGTTGTPITGSTRLDGFTITAGNANGSSQHSQGGGFLCDASGSGNECSPHLSSILFSGNLAKGSGGAMYNDGSDTGTSSPTLTDVIFSNNSVRQYYGGAMCNIGNNGTSSPNLTDVEFSGNSAAYGGGAMSNSSSKNGTSSPSLTDVGFYSNSAGFGGGAMDNYSNRNGTSSPTLTNVLFSGNSAYTGGAMGNHNYQGSTNPILINVIFSGNSAVGEGGAMSNSSTFSNTNPTLSNVLFSGNSAGESGGAVYNTASASGTSKPTLTNVTFSGNSAGKFGGAMFNVTESGSTTAPQVRNSILWNNQDSSGTGTISTTIYLSNTAVVSLTHSLVQSTGGSGSVSWPTGYIDGGGNIDVDPLFLVDIDPSTAPTTTGNLRLGEGSPAVETGHNDFVSGVTTDLDGESRIKDGDGDGTNIVDMGAYEYLTHYLLTVEKGGTGHGNVTISPGDIDCGETCQEYLKENIPVTLVATPDNDSLFTIWSGDCTGMADCELTMASDKRVRVNFGVDSIYFLPELIR